VRDINKAHTNQFLKFEERLLACRHLALEMLEKQSIVLRALDVTRAIENARLSSVLSAKGKPGNALERAETDVRVCSFLQLDDDGSLRFAHKSYYEFFLAQSCFLDAVDDPRSLRKYANLMLTREVLYFVGSFARSDQYFTSIVKRGISGELTEENSSSERKILKNFLYRVAVAAGTLLNRLSIVSGTIENVDFRKCELEGAYFRDIHFVGVAMRSIYATRLEISTSVFQRCEIAQCEFHTSKLDIALDEVPTLRSEGM
jgi:hypothetical protein